MARKNETTSTENTSTDQPFRVEYGPFSVAYSDLAEHALHYLAQYGFAKSLQDSVAGMKKALSDEGKSEAEIDAALQDTMQKRVTAIMQGTIGARVGTPRMTGIEKVMADIAREDLKAAAVSVKRKLPTGKELTELVNKYIARHEATLREKAQARLDSAQNAADDAAEILGLLDVTD